MQIKMDLQEGKKKPIILLKHLFKLNIQIKYSKLQTLGNS